jgi:membrane protein insertase Oxa1/YidC/SpoIIIJ
VVAGSNPAAPTNFTKDHLMTFLIVFLFLFGFFIPLSILYSFFNIIVNIIVNYYIKKIRSDNLEYMSNENCYEKEVNARHEWDEIYNLDY